MQWGGSKMAKDPVCGMEVNEKEAVATSEYEGKTYYFCALGCKKAFDENPEKYLKGGHQPGWSLTKWFRRLRK